MPGSRRGYTLNLQLRYRIWTGHKLGFLLHIFGSKVVLSTGTSGLYLADIRADIRDLGCRVQGIGPGYSAHALPIA